MSNLKKYCKDTFNDIHAPNSVRKEVLNMAKKINQQNNVIEDNNQEKESYQAEVVRNSYSKKLIACVTSVIVIFGGILGFKYIEKHNQELIASNSSNTEVTTIEEESSISNNDNIVTSSALVTTYTSNDIIENSETSDITTQLNETSNTDNTTTITTDITTTVATTKTTTTTSENSIETTTTVDTTTTQETTTLETTQETVITTNKKVYSLATPMIAYNVNSSEKLPQFLDTQLQQLFQDAYSIQQMSAFGSMFDYNDNDTLILNDRYYNRISSEEITTLDDLKSYFEQYFTDDFINNNGMMDNFIEQNGSVYGIDGARGGDISYLGHSFVLDSQSNDRIVFHAIAYYQDYDNTQEMYSGDGFYNQEPDIPYTTKTFNYTIVNTENGWRFDTLDTMV